MHILMLTITIALVVCVLLLVAFGLFMISPFAHHVDRFHEPGHRQDSPRLDRRPPGLLPLSILKSGAPFGIIRRRRRPRGRRSGGGCSAA